MSAAAKLMARWLTPGSQTTSLPDVTGNGFDATAPNATDWTYSTFGGVVGMKATSNARRWPVTTPGDLLTLPQTHNFTAAVWALGESGAGNAAFAWDGTDDLMVYPYDTGGRFRVFWRDVATVNDSASRADGTTTRLFFLTATSSTSRELYVNDETTPVASSTASGSGAGPFSGFDIGGWAGGAQGFINGFIFDVMVFDEALTQAERIAVFGAGPKGDFSGGPSGPSAAVLRNYRRNQLLMVE